MFKRNANTGTVLSLVSFKKKAHGNTEISKLGGTVRVRSVIEVLQRIARMVFG